LRRFIGQFNRISGAVQKGGNVVFRRGIDSRITAESEAIDPDAIGDFATLDPGKNLFSRPPGCTVKFTAVTGVSLTGLKQGYSDLPLPEEMKPGMRRFLVFLCRETTRHDQEHEEENGEKKSEIHGDPVYTICKYRMICWNNSYL
jgi:hypothetical protein